MHIKHETWDMIFLDRTTYFGNISSVGQKINISGSIGNILSVWTKNWGDRSRVPSPTSGRHFILAERVKWRPEVGL